MGDSITSLRLVELRGVLTEVVRQAHDGLCALARTLPTLEDDDRKRALLQQLHAARQQLQRLGVVVGWSAKARALAECRRVLEAVALHSAALQDAADQLAYLHSELSWSAPPAYDVGSAVHVLAQGTYNLLPACIEEEAGLKPLAGDGVKAQSETILSAMSRLDFNARSKLLKEGVPKGAKVVSVQRGVTTIDSVEGLYRVRLALVPAPSKSVTLSQYGATPGDTEVSQERKDEDQESECLSGEGPAWRWRVLSVVLLPWKMAPSQRKKYLSVTDNGTPMHDQDEENVSLLLPLPNSITDWLRQSLEQQMWAAADVGTLVAEDKLKFVELPQAAAQRSKDASDKGSLTVGDGVTRAGATSLLIDGLLEEKSVLATGDRSQGEAETSLPEWRTRPLLLMHRLLSRTAARGVLGSLIVPSVRSMTEAEPWKGHFRVERAGSGLTGIRLVLWTWYPSWMPAELALLREEAMMIIGNHKDVQQQQPTVNGPDDALRTASSLPLSLEVRLASPDEESFEVEVLPELPLALQAWSPLHVSLPVAHPNLSTLLMSVLDAAAALCLLSIQRELHGAGQATCCLRRQEAGQDRNGDGEEEGAGCYPGKFLPLATTLPRLCSPRLDIWASRDALSSNGIDTAADVVLAVDAATGQVSLETGSLSEEVKNGTVNKSSASATAEGLDRLRLALQAAEVEAREGPLSTTSDSSRIYLRARLVSRAIRRYLAVRAADRRIQAIQEAVTSLVSRDADNLGSRSAAPGRQRAFAKVVTARRVSSRLLTAMAAMDGAAMDIGNIASALVVDLPCFPADAKLMITQTVSGRTSSSQGKSLGGLSSRSGIVGVSILVRASAESDSLAADLLVQSATSRGIRLRTIRVLRLTHDLRLDDGSHATVSSVGKRKSTTGLKRGREEQGKEEDEVAGPRAAVKQETSIGLGSTNHEQSLAYQPGFTTNNDGPESYKIGSTTAVLDSSLALSRAVLIAWRAQIWYQLLSQLELLGLAPVEEWRLMPSGGFRRLAVVARPPGLGALDRSVYHFGKSENGLAHLKSSKPETSESCRGESVEFSVDGDGCWEVVVPSLYFGAWQEHLYRAGLNVDMDGASIQDAADGGQRTITTEYQWRQARGKGLVLCGDFSKGQSLIPAVHDMLAALRLHLCLCRIIKRCRNGATERSLLSQRPNGKQSNNQGPELVSSRLKEDVLFTSVNGYGSSEKGTSMPNGVRAEAAPCSWEVPGSLATCQLVRADLLSAQFVVRRRCSAAVSTATTMASSHEEPDDQAVLLRVSVSWMDEPSSTSDGQRGAGPGPFDELYEQDIIKGSSNNAPAPSGIGKRRNNGGRAAQEIADRQQSKAIRCRLSCEPALPSTLVSCLEEALEAGQEAQFLDALCAACPVILDAQQVLLSEKAQRAAGLLPGALTLLSPKGKIASKHSLPPHQALSAQIVQGLRALRLSVAGFAGGLARLEISRLSTRIVDLPTEEQDTPPLKSTDDWFGHLVHQICVGEQPDQESINLEDETPNASSTSNYYSLANRIIIWIPETSVVQCATEVMKVVAAGTTKTSLK